MLRIRQIWIGIGLLNLAIVALLGIPRLFVPTPQLTVLSKQAGDWQFNLTDTQTGLQVGLLTSSNWSGNLWMPARNMQLWDPDVPVQVYGEYPTEDLHWSPDGRRLAFVARPNGNTEIFLLDTATNQVTNLTNAPAIDHQFDWSPDGQNLVFASNRSGNWDLYILHVETRHVEPLTADADRDRNPRWSPDGTQIAFTTSRDGRSRLMLLNLHDRTQQQMPKDGVIYAHIWRNR